MGKIEKTSSSLNDAHDNFQDRMIQTASYPHEMRRIKEKTASRQNWMIGIFTVIAGLLIALLVWLLER